MINTTSTNTENSSAAEVMEHNGIFSDPPEDEQIIELAIKLK